MKKDRRVFLFNRYLFGIFVLFLFCFCAIGCSQPHAAPQSDTSYVPSVWARDFAPGQLHVHYLKHRDEFGDITIEEYLENARALLNAQPGKDVQEKRRENGDFLRFRLSTGEFAVMTKDGRIRTYFKTHYRYWAGQ